MYFYSTLIIPFGIDYLHAHIYIVSACCIVAHTTLLPVTWKNKRRLISGDRDRSRSRDRRALKDISQ